MYNTSSSFEFSLKLTLNIIILAIKFLFAIYLGKKILLKKKDKGYLEFNFISSYCIMMLLSSIASCFFIYLLFFDPNEYYKMPIVIYWKLATVIEYISYIPVFFVIEWKVLNFKLKAIPSFILLIISLLILFYPIDSQDDIEFLSNFVIVAVIAGFFIFATFLYIGIKIPGLRKPALLYVFGAIINTIGQQLTAETILISMRDEYGLTMYTIMQIFALILRILGLVLVVAGISHFEYVREDVEEEPAEIRISDKAFEFKETKASLIEALEASRPDIITEEEISYFREQELCLVCRGKVLEPNKFICPHCDSLYCNNCAIALSNAENVCWVCNNPIDESKPSKPFEKPKDKVKRKKSKRKPKTLKP